MSSTMATTTPKAVLGSNGNSLLPTRAADIVEMESLMSLDQPFESKVMPRWERKKLQKMGSGGGNLDSDRAGNQDRFIPNRSAMHMEKAHYALSKENSNPQGDGAATVDKDAAAGCQDSASSVVTQEAATVQKKGK